MNLKRLNEIEDTPTSMAGTLELCNGIRYLLRENEQLKTLLEGAVDLLEGNCYYDGENIHDPTCGVCLWRTQVKDILKKE